jgi:RNA polymerase sigma-70 factor (ECF subfamily)
VGTNDTRTDYALVEAAKRGDERAFRTLYHRYRPWVMRLGMRFTGNREDALDVLQETFLYVLRKLPALHLSASVPAFLYPVVKNLAITAHRKKKRLTISDEILSNVPAPEEAQVPLQDLARALRGLGPYQREVVLMRFVDDMRLTEIASALDIPLGTVKSRLHNALKSLRDDERIRRYFLE